MAIINNVLDAMNQLIDNNMCNMSMKNDVSVRIYFLNQHNILIVVAKPETIAGRCILCHNDVQPNTDEAWRKHLNGGRCNNESNTNNLTKQQKQTKKTKTDHHRSKQSSVATAAVNRKQQIVIMRE